MHHGCALHVPIHSGTSREPFCLADLRLSLSNSALGRRESMGIEDLQCITHSLLVGSAIGPNMEGAGEQN